MSNAHEDRAEYKSISNNISLFSISSVFIANEIDDGMRWKTRKKIFKNYSSRIILSHMICIQYVLLLILFLSYSKFSFVTIGNYLLACEHKCADILPMTSLSPSIRMACRICWKFSPILLQMYLLISTRDTTRNDLLASEPAFYHCPLYFLHFSRYNLDLLKIFFTSFCHEFRQYRNVMLYYIDFIGQTFIGEMWIDLPF